MGARGEGVKIKTSLCVGNGVAFLNHPPHTVILGEQYVVFTLGCARSLNVQI